MYDPLGIQLDSVAQMSPSPAMKMCCRRVRQHKNAKLPSKQATSANAISALPKALLLSTVRLSWTLSRILMHCGPRA